ncbi:MAG: DUF1963 domain-containing protein [Chloroflexota bacterium]
MSHEPGAGREAVGLRGPLGPRPRSYDEALLAAAPAGARGFERTAYLAETELGDLGAGSGFGGRPYLPGGTEHPRCPGCGEAMPLLVQLDTASMPAGIASGEGLLQVFYCGATDDLSPCPAGLEDWEAFSPVHVQRLVPALSDGRVSVAGEALVPRRVTRWLPVPDLPGWEELTALGVDAGEPPDDVWELPYDGEKLGGWPRWVQGIEYPSCRVCGRTMAPSSRSIPSGPCPSRSATWASLI